MTPAEGRLLAAMISCPALLVAAVGWKELLVFCLSVWPPPSSRRRSSATKESGSSGLTKQIPYCPRLPPFFMEIFLAFEAPRGEGAPSARWLGNRMTEAFRRTGRHTAIERNPKPFPSNHRTPAAAAPPDASADSPGPALGAANAAPVASRSPIPFSMHPSLQRPSICRGRC